MRRRLLVIPALVCTLVITSFAQSRSSGDTTSLKRLISYTSELEFQAELVNYVEQNYFRYGEKQIPQEKFLINLMYLINDEVSNRLRSPEAAREKYFGELEGMLREIGELKQRLRVSGIRELDTFVDDLENRITFTLERRDINFKKKKVFSDALQMLYVSEEMIKLDSGASQGDLSQKIGESKQQLLNAFGEISGAGVDSRAVKPTIYDLFVEWKRNDETKYEVRLTDVRLARQNLLKSGGINEIQRMLQRELDVAYVKFNQSEYEVAELLLGDISRTYPRWGVKELDDVYFYQAECNFALDRLVHARDVYEKLLEDFPNTPFAADAYSRLVQISYTVRDYLNAVYYSGLYQQATGPSHSDYYDILFLNAMSHYNQNSFDKVVEELTEVPDDHPYYYLAQYFMGNAYAANQLYDDAIGIYIGLIDSKLTPPFLHARALYKMGVLEYERNNHVAAISYLQRISTAFSRYDKVLNGLAWAYFENERSKSSGELVDFTEARHYATRLTEEYYASPYVMEATGLLAYINQLENEPIQAIGLYRDVYQTKVQRGAVQSYLDERNALERLYLDASAMRDQSLRENNSTAFRRSTELMRELNAQISQMDLAETSSSGYSSYREVSRILDQLKELERLRLTAEESGRMHAVARIDSLQMRLGAALEMFPEEVVSSASAVNYFDEYPISKYVVEEESRHALIEEKRSEVLNEIARLDDMINRVAAKRENARTEQDFKLVALLDQKSGNLGVLRKRFDQLLVATYAMETNPNPYPEFNRWGDLGAFGIINVYFDQKQKTQRNLVKVAEVLDRVNLQLNERKQVIESKIRKIESEVRFMTMKARMEERSRLRAERERAFRESYFDTRESESEEE